MKHMKLPIICIESVSRPNEICYDLLSHPDKNSFYYMGEINKKENAEFIVKAVNNHYQLLETLQEVIDSGLLSGLTILHDDIKNKVYAAIHKAEES